MKNQISIKELFTEEVKQTENDTKNRMIEIMESFEQKNEVIREKSSIKASEEKLSEEKKRLMEIAKIASENTIKENNVFNYGASNMSSQMPMPMSNNVMGGGQSVNSFMSNQLIGNQNLNNDKNLKQGTSVNNLAQNLNPNANSPYNPNYTYLQSTEALRLSISRALNTGAPVNNMGFYEEVNWILNGLGFNAKSPLDIKQAILKMIKD